jgi:hypothetical protein
MKVVLRSVRTDRKAAVLESRQFVSEPTSQSLGQGVVILRAGELAIHSATLRTGFGDRAEDRLRPAAAGLRRGKCVTKQSLGTRRNAERGGMIRRLRSSLRGTSARQGGTQILALVPCFLFSRFVRFFILPAPGTASRNGDRRGVNRRLDRGGESRG